MGDVDFANDFAESLEMSLGNLKKECARVSADCIERKHAMDAALIGLNAGGAELVELAETADITIATEGWKVARECAQFFEGASKTVADVQNGWFADSIHDMLGAGDVKDRILLNARPEYGNAKDMAFNVLDDARDIQLALESAQYRLNRNADKMENYLKKPLWKYQHKYSQRITRDCVRD
jgi:hypothetical protein